MANDYLTTYTSEIKSWSNSVVGVKVCVSFHAVSGFTEDREMEVFRNKTLGPNWSAERQSEMGAEGEGVHLKDEKILVWVEIYSVY